MALRGHRDEAAFLLAAELLESRAKLPPGDASFFSVIGDDTRPHPIKVSFSISIGTLLVDGFFPFLNQAVFVTGYRR